MIVSWLTGGLGNQMFQYAAGLALAERRRTVLKLDATWFRDYPDYEGHVRYGLSCFNITEQFATQSEIDRLCGRQLTRTERWMVALARALRLRSHVRRMTPSGTMAPTPPTFAFFPEFFALPDHSYLGGMYQSEKFFAPVADLLRLHFSFRHPSSPEVEACAARIRSGPSIAINFRRGDYVRQEHVRREFGMLDLAYYHRAVALLRARSPDATLYVFSDDIEAVAREFVPAGPHEFVRCVQPGRYHDTLRLMSLCEHMAVANSTFSWWAAWLNPSPTKLIVAPDPWFANTALDTSDVVPSSWTRLPVPA